MNATVIALVSSLISGGGLLIAAFGWYRTTKKDTRESGNSAGKLEYKMDYVSKGVDDIRLDIKEQNRKLEGIDQRLTRVEESSKSAHHRIDDLVKSGDE